MVRIPSLKLCHVCSMAVICPNYGDSNPDLYSGNNT